VPLAGWNALLPVWLMDGHEATTCRGGGGCISCWAMLVASNVHGNGRCPVIALSIY
jgi:hypothetical protein